MSFFKYISVTEKGEEEILLVTKQAYEEVFVFINQLKEEVSKLSADNESLKKDVAELKNLFGENDLSKIEKEVLELKATATNARYIASRYNKLDSNRNGFSTVQIAEYLNVSTQGKEIEIAERIFKALQD